ncbi:hypothetical protein PENANT_c001G01638 [Penicillium antarcticum]|uniref:Uncharacterized protein n=1 Tax=Penicillium antarcticum TaxID=416450 RepID=A0A1V6QMR3_9EURO|nr:hypothetical protein PENANT_c001G01638 [Penicillium antarcticum]
MQHDKYSPRVCLLEIALWQSFVQVEQDLACPWSDLDIETAISDEDARRGGFTREDNVFETQSHVNDDDGIVVGVRYIENVLLKLEELIIWLVQFSLYNRAAD